MASDVRDAETPVSGDPSSTRDAPLKARFRFKTKHRSERDEPSRSSRHGSADRTAQRIHKHHHHRKRRRRQDSAFQEEENTSSRADARASPPPPASPPPLDRDTAFRESLFDALADDEAAEYWQGVYGQPVHIYSNVRAAGPAGELERMTDDEYAAHVRARMYEKTHEHLLEEKARREAARAERERIASEGRRAEHEDRRFRDEVEAALRRSRARKHRRVWDKHWATYSRQWERLGRAEEGGRLDMASLPWPVASGRWHDVGVGAVREFFLLAPSGGGEDPATTEEADRLAATLKSERVRWHPDKIQHKLGGQDVDATVMQAVTQVFQIIDRLWSETRGRA